MTEQTGQPEIDGAPIAYEKSLLRTVEILEAIKGTLDTKTHSCDSCQKDTHTNWQHYQAFEALTGAISRIAKANSLIQQSLAAKGG